jgi:hypothetical protein
MDMRKFAPDAFVKAETVRDRPFEGEIAVVKEGRFGPEIIFATGEIFSVNKTNVGILARDFGWESDDWLGKRVVLKFGYVKFDGEDKESVIVETISPPVPAAQKKKLPPQQDGRNMDDEIPF